MIDKDRAESWGGIGLPDGTRLHKVGGRHAEARATRDLPRGDRRRRTDDAAAIVVEILSRYDMVAREDQLALAVRDLAELVRLTWRRAWESGLEAGLSAQVIRVQSGDVEDLLRRLIGGEEGAR